MFSCKFFRRFMFPALFFPGLFGCVQPELGSFKITSGKHGEIAEKSQRFHEVDREVRVREYFGFIDSLVAHYDSILNYPVTEHILVRANPWLIDTLAHTDYYCMMEERDSFVYDQRKMIVLRKGDRLLIPDSLMMDSIRFRMATAVIDINIPEFKLRIRELGEVQHSFPVRVGQNRRKYLAMAGSTVDLRTRPGSGKIMRISRNPVFINPSNNHRYTHTRRDDGKTTLMPLIPWLEPEIDGNRIGQLIHPTTNIETLGKAYSNGCIGTSEAAAWWIYYHAQLGTEVNIRYDRTVIDEAGDTLRLPDVYPGFERYSPSLYPPPIAASLMPHQTISGCSPDCIGVWEGEGEREFLVGK